MRQYYLSRGGKTYGPYTEDHLRQMASAGQVVREDLLAVVGAKTWQKAAEVPGLFPGRRTPPPLPPLPPKPVAAAPAPVANITIQVACFGCFNEATLSVPAGTHSAPCRGRSKVTDRARRMADKAGRQDMDDAYAALAALRIAATIMGS